MSRLNSLINNCIQEINKAKTSGESVPGIKKLLEEELRDIEGFKRMLPTIENDETLIHSCPKMTMVLLRLSPNVHYPPHNHHMPVIMALYEGAEKNYFYKADQHGLTQEHARILSAPGVYAIESETIHSVVNCSYSDYSAALHVYCGDLVNQNRTIWSPKDGSTFSYSDETYFSLARPRDPNKPFSKPDTPIVHTTEAANKLRYQ